MLAPNRRRSFTETFLPRKIRCCERSSQTGASSFMSGTAPRSTAAVFLSYAREDAAAARRIAEALRAHEVEVWFDENELRGGDAWDAKIRRQIKECALFMPVVSAHTQERGEGYF